MFKKLFACMAVGAMIFTSCSSDEPIVGTGDGNVTFTATLPAGIQSRSAYDDGTVATALTYAVYDAQGNNIATLNGNGTFTDLKTTVSLSLVTGKTYTVVFWAAAPANAPYTFDATTGKVTVTTTGDANDAKRDAFFAAETFTVTGAINKTVELRRPFAQINIGTNDLEAFQNAGGTITTSGLTVTAPNVLDLRDGSVSGEAEYTFAPTAFATGDFPVAGYTWLTTNYILVGADKTTVDVKWTSDNTNNPAVTYSYVPVQRNYRTNIYGALLNNPVDYNVEIKPEFGEGDNNQEFDSQGYAVAKSLEDAQKLLAEGTPKVSVDGQLLVAPAAAAIARSGNDVVEFFLNKTVKSQSLKITGRATTGVKFSYKETVEGETAVATPAFSLVVVEQNAVPSVAFAEIEDAKIEVDSKIATTAVSIEAAEGFAAVEKGGHTVVLPEALKNYTLVENATELKTAISNNAQIVLGNDITFAADKTVDGVEIKNVSNLVIDFNGHEVKVTESSYDDTFSISASSVTLKNGILNWPSVRPLDPNNFGATVYISGQSDVTFDNMDISGSYSIWINSKSANININSGKYFSKATSVYVSKPKNATIDDFKTKVVINGGEYNTEGELSKYCLNLQDALSKAETLKANEIIAVIAGKFYNFDPSESKSENPIVNFVANGSTCVETSENVWTVSKN